VGFSWDETKNRRNLAKHGIGFEAAVSVFEDPGVLSVRDRTVDGEERWHTLGIIGVVVVLVVHTFREEADEEEIRIISARKATPLERKAYEQSSNR